MLKKFIAPIALTVVILLQLTISTLNASDSTQQNERETNYFIKPILESNVVVVEPNYGRFFNPDRTIEKDVSEDILYAALDELNEDYNIDGTKMVRFDRKGQIVPNLYIRVSEKNALPELQEAIISSVPLN